MDQSQYKRVRQRPISGKIITMAYTSMIVEISKNKSPSTKAALREEELPPPRWIVLLFIRLSASRRRRSEKPHTVTLQPFSAAFGINFRRVVRSWVRKWF